MKNVKIAVILKTSIFVCCSTYNIACFNSAFNGTNRTLYTIANSKVIVKNKISNI